MEHAFLLFQQHRPLWLVSFNWLRNQRRFLCHREASEQTSILLRPFLPYPKAF